MSNIEQFKKEINEALGMCSERSPRWRAVVLKLEDILQQIDALYQSVSDTGDLLLTDEEIIKNALEVLHTEHEGYLLVAKAIRADERAKTLKEIVSKLDDYFRGNGMGKPHGRTTLARQMAKHLILNIILEPSDQLKQGKLE